MAGGLGGVFILQFGFFQVIFFNVFGCDQVIVGFLIIILLGFIIVDIIVCEGEFVIIGDIFNGGFIFIEMGFYLGNFIDLGGCQSIFQLDFIVYDLVINIDIIICNGELLIVGGDEYSVNIMDLEIILFF